MVRQKIDRGLFAVRAVVLAGLAIAGAGCGSTGSGAATDDDLHPDGFPFVVEANAVSDVCSGPVSSCAAGRNPAPGATTVELSQPETGKVCLQGAVAPAGYAFAVLIFTEYNSAENGVLKTFNADALGITQAAFTIDSPPADGVTVIGAVVKQVDCPGSPHGEGCRTSGFSLMTDPALGVPRRITASGTVTAPFANFVQTDATINASFDTSALDSLAFFVGPGATAFCIEAFKFLDASGNEVAPP